MLNRRSIVMIVVALALFLLPSTILAQNDFQGLVKDTYAVTTANGDVDALAVVKCYQDGGVGPFLVEVIGSYTNNTTDAVIIETTVTFNEGADQTLQTSTVSPTTNGNSQFFLGENSATGIEVFTEVFVSGVSVGSSTSATLEASCSTTAVSLSSVSASTASINWVIAAAALLLGLATAVVWQRRQHA